MSVKSIVIEIRKIQPNFSRWETTPLSGKCIFGKITDATNVIMITDNENEQTENERTENEQTENEQAENQDHAILTKPIAKEFILQNPSEMNEMDIYNFVSAQQAALLVYDNGDKEYASRTLSAFTVLRNKYAAVMSNAALHHLDQIKSVIRVKFALDV